MGSVLVRNGCLLAETGDLETADLLIEDGVITGRARALDAPAGVEVLDVEGSLVVPGLVNAHTHSNQTLEKGLCDALPLDAWMVIASYGGAGALMGPEELRIAALMGAAEMLRTGTTSVVDCVRVDESCLAEGLDAVMNAYIDSGMRAGVAAQYADLDFFSSLPLELIDGGEALLGPPRAAPADVLEEVDDFLQRWSQRHSRVTPMLGPSSLPRCSTELFEASIDLARRRGARLQTHLLSARSQVPFAQARYGGSTVDYLDRLGCLEEWASFAHAIWLDDDEVVRLASSEATAVHNPVSNLKLGAGLAPAPKLWSLSGRVALGADGASSNDSQNMWETVKMAAILHRIALDPDDWPGSSDALQMCWRGGASVMGQNLGRLEVGALGDVAVLGWGQLLPAPPDQVRHQLVYSELGSSVRWVVVDGDVVVRDGAVQTFDVEAVQAAAAEIVERIWSTLPARLERFDEVAPLLRRLERAVSELPIDFRRSCCW